ncbi:LuxR C-terminal-related transcriptional regulator [Streptomyces sp. NPDC090445]|uniref:helix-turn-helix transcriptional regulator n=1 Tax=Streptomyces sp. NPDC090445 TaxID=3365963 RepID=UPI0038024C06
MTGDAAPGPALLSDPPGLETELADLRRMFGIGSGAGSTTATGAVTDSDHAFVLVRGGHGSGKSALVRALLGGARSEGRTVLAAWAERAASRDELAVLRQLHAAARPESAVRPESAARPESAVRPPAHTPDGHPAELAALLAALLATRGSRPLLCVEDLQSADGSSLRALRRLMRRVDGRAPAVIATLGPGEAADEEALGALLPLFHEQLDLLPLTPDAIRDLLVAAGRRAPGAPLVHACLTATGGNRFLLLSLLAALDTDHTGDGEEAVAAAARDLALELAPAAAALLRGSGPHAEPLAQALAVLGTPQPVELAAEVTGVPLPAAEDTAHLLERAGLLRRCGRGVRLAAALLSDAVEQSVPPSRRKELHALAARFLLDRAAPPDQVAHHVVNAAPGLPFAAEVLRRAAVEATDAGAPDRAARLLRSALREPLTERRRSSVLSLLGEAELESSVPTAIEGLRRSLRLSNGPGERTSAARRLAGALFAVDRYLDALDVLERTSAAIRPVDPAHALRLEIDFLFVSLVEVSSAARTHPRLMALAMSEAREASTVRPLAALLSLRGAMVGEDPAEVVRLARLALGNGMVPADDESVVYHCAVLALGAAGRPDLAHEYADTAVAEARARGAVFQYSHAISTRGNAHARMGRIPDCRADAEAALEALQEVGVPLGASHTVFAVATLVEALTRQGRIDEAQSLLDRSGLNGHLQPYWINDYPLIARGWLRIAQDRPEDALADFLECGARTGARNMPGPGFYPWRSEAALVHARLGRADEALRLAEEEAELARAWAVPEMQGVALRALGLVTGGPRGRYLLDEAVGILRQSPARFRYAQALADRGLVGIRCGRVTEGRADLQEAASIAHECGADGLAEAALRELRALGDRPRTRTFQGVEALTPTERRVAALAVEGMTNRQIAEHLFVGLRTVEIHLTHVYAKLGIKGRRELAGALD